MQSGDEDERRDAALGNVGNTGNTGNTELEEVRKLIREALGKLDQLVD